MPFSWGYRKQEMPACRDTQSVCSNDWPWVTARPATKEDLVNAAGITADKRSSKALRRLRILGTFLLGLAIAVLGTAIVDSPFERYTVGASLRASMFRMDVLTGCFAFGLGYGVFRKWKFETSKWIWIAGLCWFGRRFLLPPDGNHVLSWEIFATRSVFTDWVAMGNWSIYTMPLIRSVSYSAGALACSVIGGRAARQAIPAG
jgi:hypothetical protein